jgi:hypothetical protein
MDVTHRVFREILSSYGSVIRLRTCLLYYAHCTTHVFAALRMCLLHYVRFCCTTHVFASLRTYFLHYAHVCCTTHIFAALRTKHQTIPNKDYNRSADLLQNFVWDV